MNGLGTLDSVARHRLLALMGVDVYVLRGSRDAAGAAASGVAGRAVAASEAARANNALVVVCDPAETGVAPLAGRYGRLLRHVFAALELDASEVHFGHHASGFAGAQPDLRQESWLCFGAVPVPAGRDAWLAAPLATLHQSADAKRALWHTLRPLRRRMMGR